MEYFHWPAWLAVWPCSLPAPTHLLVSWVWETGKSPRFHSNSWKHQCYQHSSCTKYETQQLLGGKKALSQLQPGHCHFRCPFCPTNSLPSQISDWLCYQVLVVNRGNLTAVTLDCWKKWLLTSARSWRFSRCSAINLVVLKCKKKCLQGTQSVLCFAV